MVKQLFFAARGKPLHYILLPYDNELTKGNLALIPPMPILDVIPP